MSTAQEQVGIDRHREGQTDTDWLRQTDRQAHTGRQIHTDRRRHTDRHIRADKYTQTDKYKQPATDIQKGTNRQTDRQKGIQTNKRTDQHQKQIYPFSLSIPFLLQDYPL